MSVATGAGARHALPSTRTGSLQRVALATASGYPDDSPFHPAVGYPEYPFKNYVSARRENAAYEGVRNLLHALGYDRDNYDTRKWNPLGELIEPGMTVVLKPNWVLSRHPGGKSLWSVITHPAVIRAVADYCWIALRGSGRIIVADAPQYDCNFEELMAATRLPDIRDFLAAQGGPELQVRDLRYYWSPGRHFASMTRPLAGDPEGQVSIELGDESAFGARSSERYYGAVYHRSETAEAQHAGVHRYAFSATILNADVLISIPKLKVHKKVGVTLNLKGLMGTTTNKNLCVHYSLGSSAEGGDQYPAGWFTPPEEALIKLERWMYDHLLAPRSRSLEYIHRTAYWLHGKTFGPLGWRVPPHKRLLDAGNWYGNDSAWRMVADLARMIHFSDRNGRLHETQQRRMFSVVDGIVGGENNGPLSPDPKHAGILLAGEGYAAVDVAATRWMGFIPQRLGQFNVLRDSTIDLGVRGLDDLELVSDDAHLIERFNDAADQCAAFIPHPGWRGRIEIGS